jgi:hypothetical protein
MWMFNVLEYAAWGPHDPGCRCALDDVDDPVVRVMACSTTVKEILEEEMAKPESGDLYAFVQVHGPETFTQTLLDHPRLNDHLHAEMKIRHRELASRRARYARQASWSSRGLPRHGLPDTPRGRGRRPRRGPTAPPGSWSGNGARPRSGRRARLRPAGVRGALEPYQWHRVRPRLLARIVLGAVDRAGRSGREVAAGPVPRDRRIEELVRVLDGQSWRALTVPELCQRLLEALHDWGLRDRCLDVEIAWLLEEIA